MSGAENTAAQIPLAPICSRGRSAQQHGLGGVAGVGPWGGGGIPLGGGGGDTIGGGGGVVAPDPRAYMGGGFTLPYANMGPPWPHFFTKDRSL